MPAYRNQWSGLRTAKACITARACRTWRYVVYCSIGKCIELQQDGGRNRKHSRTWEHGQLHGAFETWQLAAGNLTYILDSNGYPCDVPVGAPDYMDSYRSERQYNPQDMSGMPPRKRIHHAMIPGFDVMNGAPLQTQNMTLQS